MELNRNRVGRKLFVWEAKAAYKHGLNDIKIADNNRDMLKPSIVIRQVEN